MPRASSIVGSRITAAGNLEFFSRKLSNSVIFTIRGDTGVVEFPAGSGISEIVTRTDVDAQNATLSAAGIEGRLIVHTSVTGAGTATFDTAANIIAAIPSLATLGASWRFTYINDGDQTVTLANDAGPSVTISDTGQTVATNESVEILLVNTGAGALAAHVVGA